VQKFIIKLKAPLGDGNYGTMDALIESEEMMISPETGNLTLFHHEEAEAGEVFAKLVIDFYANADSVISCGKRQVPEDTNGGE
jgi:hypothetical protein